MQNNTFSVEGLFDFLNAGVSAFHSTAAAVHPQRLCPRAGMADASAVLAWRMPKGELTGWHAAASHSDSPTWRIKQLDGGKDNVFAKAETEGYGGMIMPSWLDRPLTVAGRLLVRTESGIGVSGLPGPCAGLHPEPLHPLQPRSEQRHEV